MTRLCSRHLTHFAITHASIVSSNNRESCLHLIECTLSKSLGHQIVSGGFFVLLSFQCYLYYVDWVVFSCYADRMHTFFVILR